MILKNDIVEQWDNMVYDIKRQRVDKVKEDIKFIKNFNPNATFRRNGESLLHVCAEFNCRPLFEWLVSDHKGDPFKQNEAGETPLIIAAREGKFDIVKMFIENYSSWGDYLIDHKMADGWTAMQYATMNGFKQIAEYLIKNGADVNTSDRLHRSALHWACRFNNVKILEMLLAKNIKTETTDIEMQTPLDLATRYNNKDCMEILSAHKKKKKDDAARRKK